MEPRYAENIIVGVKDDQKFKWYITDKDIWIMDIYKYERAYQQAGYIINLDFILSLRNNIAILNENNYKQYLSFYNNCVITTQELKKKVMDRQYCETVLELRPSLYIDFLNKKLYSLYPESIPFEKYVPDGWEGKYENFQRLLDVENQYWINEGDLIDKIFQEEKARFKGGNI